MVSKKICKQIKDSIHYNEEDPSSKRNYKRAKKKYKSLSSEAKPDFLKLLNDFYNQKK
jgi:hypothetical protein